MEKRAIIGIVLFLSMVLLMYPQVTTYLDLEESLGGLRSVPTAILKARDDARSQIIGFFLLYATLFLMLHFMKLRNGGLPSSATEQASLPPAPSLGKPLGKETIDNIFILSAAVFFAAYVLQMIGLMISKTTTSTTNNFTEFLTPVFYALTASATVGVVAYLIAKYSNYSFRSSIQQHKSLIHSDAVEGQAMEKPEDADWYQQALRQHQVEINKTDDVEDSQD